MNAINGNRLIPIPMTVVILFFNNLRLCVQKGYTSKTGQGGCVPCPKKKTTSSGLMALVFLIIIFVLCVMYAVILRNDRKLLEEANAVGLASIGHIPPSKPVLSSAEQGSGSSLTAGGSATSLTGSGDGAAASGH